MSEEEAPDIVEIMDERTPLAGAALRLLEHAFDARDRQPLEELRSEIEERRLGLLITSQYHMLAAVRPDGHVEGAISGVYLQGINAGFIFYLVVDRASRGRRIGRRIRSRLVETFDADSRNAGYAGLAWVLGEVRHDNPWIRGLARRRGAIPFDLAYFHPGMHVDDPRRYVLYRQPINDARAELPAEEVVRVLYQIYRRAYRTRYPLQRDTFRAMVSEAMEKGVIGYHPDFVADPD